MKLSGHTMGMPEKDIYESISFCAELGLDGIEVRCADNGQMDLDTIEDDQVKRIAEHAQNKGIEFACLTPYYRDFMTPEAAEESLSGYRNACRIAMALQCPIIRCISGIWPQDDYEREEVFERTVTGVHQAGDIASEYGITLAVETHRGQLAFSAADALEFVNAVDHPQVAVLWDVFWTYVAGEESVEEAMEMLAPHIVHVHAKNIEYDEDDEYETVILDQGELDWCEIIQGLADIGYEGYISDEYEKFWRPHLPEPEVGMKRNHEVLRACLDEIGL